jgi:Protein of unknown function (DUF3617)
MSSPVLPQMHCIFWRKTTLLHRVRSIFIMRRQYSKIRGQILVPFYAAVLTCCAALTACSGPSPDQNKDGEVSGDERAIATGIKQLPPMKPGLWQVKVTFDTAQVTGLSDRKKQEMLLKMSKAASSNRCLSKAGAASPPASFYGGEATGQCRYQSFDVTNGTAKIAFSCTRDNMATLDTQLLGTSNAADFDFTMRNELRLPMIGNVDLRGVATGRYLGPCDT